MSGLIKRIEQELTDLESAIANADSKVQSLRQQYIQIIANASAHQIILATYQLCTKEYPNAFLALSLDVRQKLQTDIQLLAFSFSQSIIGFKGKSISENPPESTDESEENLSPESFNDVAESEEKLLSQSFNRELDADSLEKIVSQTLTEATQSVHQLLADRGLMSLPLAEDTPSIQLRLLDIELSDRQAHSIRSEIRVLEAKRQQLCAELEKKQKSKLIAQAELAWRSTWVEIERS
jgi:hypothetical protein